MLIILKHKLINPKEGNMINFINFKSELIKDTLDACTLHLGVDAVVTQMKDDQYKINHGEREFYVTDLESVVRELFFAAKTN